MKCPYCNANITKAKFCPECGKEIDTGLTESQKSYLKRKKTGHNIKTIVGGVVGGAGVGFGIINIIGGIVLIIIGILLSLTIIGAIIGIPMIIIGAGMLGMGGASTVAGGISTGTAMHSAKKSEEIEDRLRGVKK